MSYNELLNDQRWRTKRNQILVRDKHTCQRCGISPSSNFNATSFKLGTNFQTNFGIEYINEDSNTKIIRLVKNTGQEIICKTSLAEYQINLTTEYTILVNFAIKNFIKYPYNGATVNNLKDNIFISPGTNSALIKALEKHKSTLAIDLEGIWFVEKKNEEEFSKNSQALHVHHKCYRKNYEIWNQDDDDYVSLCNVCHQIVHINQLIPYYDEVGRIYQYMKPCPRCNGKRILECYKHVQNGICFQCKGEGVFMT
ncbi:MULTISPECIES: HNH endonuclease [Flavobacterium]|uniref:Uncharacterized protein n=1 Tax=Flavobacterium commune TaxID=1306519 RepID=A0A1D9P8F0_9FLAO|nr:MULTISPECIES: hypothetical protein [Flavobacterium]AOZ98829.1 hypothetical protein BIW12_04935 [Flavobacterium commune]